MSIQPSRPVRLSWLASSVVLAGVLSLSLGWARAAEAINCHQWNQLGPDQKVATIDRMIESAIGGSGGRQYQVDRNAIGRCLAENAVNMEYDFDGACADSRSASMQALNKIFKSYAWSCAG